MLKVRKRVTLTVVIISAILGVSWGTHSILHVMDDIGSYKLSPIAIPISHVMIMVNSAINPFAYALINQRFRDKMKGMFCCISAKARSPSRQRTTGQKYVSSAQQHRTIEPSDTINWISANSHTFCVFFSHKPRQAVLSGISLAECHDGF